MMDLSEKGLSLLKQFEGLKLSIYLDKAGKETIGYGHLLTDLEKKENVFSEGITETEAANILRADAGKAIFTVNHLVKVPLNQNQFDALVSLTFNCGGAPLSQTLGHLLNEGKYDAVAAQFLRWDKREDPHTGHVVEDAGLRHRRQIEAELWETPV
jgi:lysozyme